MFGRSILNALGLGSFEETNIPRGAELAASEDDRRGPEALKKCVKALRDAGGTSTEKYDGVGITVLEGMPKLNLSYDKLDKLLLCAAARLVRKGRSFVGTRMDYASHESMRTFVPISFGSSQTGRAAKLWQAILDMAADCVGDAKIFVKWKEDAEKVVSAASGQSMKVMSGTGIRMDNGGRSRTHGDGAHFHARTVTVVMKQPHATKRVSLGLACDDRPRGTRRLLHPSEWIYLGDLVLRNKDTYIGDVVAMGGKSVGGGGEATSALVHRVNPVEGAEWVLIIDWFRVQEQPRPCKHKMTIGSGAWADRLDALLRDRRELFEAQAEENILMVILLAVPRFGALAIAYALLLLCRVGAPVVNRLKPVWNRFVASDDRTEATRPEERVRAEAEARADRNARELLAAEEASRSRVRRRAPPPRKKKAPPPATRSPAPAPATAPPVIAPAPPPPVAAPAPAPVPQPAVTVQAPAVAPAPAVAVPAPAPPPAAAPPAPAASSAPAAEAPAPAAEAPAPAAEAPSPASEAPAPVDAPAPARESPSPPTEAPAPAAEAPAPADAPAPAPVEEPWQPAQPARRRSRAAREPTEPKAPTGRRRGTVKVVKPGYCFVVPDAGGPDVFCATRLNDTIAAGDRLEYDLVPNEGRSAHKAGNVTILPRAAPRPAPVPAPAPAAVKPVADKPAPRWSSAEAARDTDALEFFYEGDASKLEPRFVASVESLLGQRRREQLARNFAAADALREGLRTSYGVVSSDHKQRGSRDPRTTWRIVKATPAPSTDGAAVRVVTASPEALARKAITVGGETLEDFLGRLGLLGYAARLHDEELTILDLPLASASDLVAVGLPRPAAERICASAQDGSPPEFLCPITMEAMTDPVFAADGHVYDRASIESFLETHDTSPLTNEPLATRSLTPNDALRSRLRERATAPPRCGRSATSVS